MAEKEYIEREAVNDLIKAECSPKVAAYLIDAVATVPAADVRPVVRKPVVGMDELIKRLREHNGWALNETLDQAADAIEELVAVCKKQEIELVELTGELASKPCWIPVTERLPEESYDGFSDDVLMLIEEPDGDKIWRNPYVGYYLYDACSDETGWWVKMTCDCTRVGEHKHGGKIYKANEYVTHWMPLPEPPKEE